MQTKITQREKIFIAYTKQDVEWLNRFLVHLTSQVEQGVIDLWNEEQLNVGIKWMKPVEDALEEAKFIILLVSEELVQCGAFVRSCFPLLLSAAKKEGSIVIPLLIKPSRFCREDHLSIFQPINNPHRPLINLSKKDQDNILQGLAKQIESFLKK